MRITTTMDLGLLAECMGPEATPEDAAAMRDRLAATSYTYTDEIPDAEWLALLGAGDEIVMPGHEGFTYSWKDGGRAMVVTYRGENPSRHEDGQEVQDAGLVDWPSDYEISVAVGKRVRFHDAGDNLCEAIFFAVE